MLTEKQHRSAPNCSPFSLCPLVYNMDWEPLWFSKPFELVSTGFLLESPDISFTVKISAISLQKYSDTSFAPSMARKGYSCQSFYLCPLLNGSRETFFSLHILGYITHWGLSWKRGFCCWGLHLCKTTQVTGSPESGRSRQNADKWSWGVNLLPIMFRGYPGPFFWLQEMSARVWSFFYQMSWLFHEHWQTH